DNPTAPVVATVARALNNGRRGAEALALLNRHPPPRLGLGPWYAVWYLERARALALTGDGAAARNSLLRAQAIWSHADSALVGEVAAVADQVRRAGGRP